MGTESSPRLFAGYGDVDITPEPGMPMAGYINRAGKAIGAHDALKARVTYIDVGGEEVVLAVLDLIRVDDALRSRLASAISKATGVKEGRILIAATHTHSGPEVSTGIWSTQELMVSDREAINEYLRTLEYLVASASLTAMERSVRVAEVRVGVKEVSGVATNRVSSDGVIDKKLTLMSLEYVGGGRLLIINYACHPTVLGPDNVLYSGDLAGLTAELTRTYLGADVIYLNGAAGNVSTRFSRNKQDFEEALRKASILADSAASAYVNSRPIHVGPLHVKSKEMALRLRPPIDESLINKLKGELLKRLEEARRSGASPSVIRSLERDVYAVKIAERRNKLLKGVKSVKASITASWLGDEVALLTFPGELFVEYQLDLKEAVKPSTLLLAGYANGYVGYVPYPGYSGKGCYEELVSIIDEGEYPRIKEELIKLLTDG